MHSRTDSPIITSSLSEIDSPLLAIVTAVATVENVQPTSLPPLSRAIDPDALGTLVDSIDGELTVSFRYEGYRVVVTDERVELY